MSARDEYELVDATSDTVTLTGDDYDAAMDRIDTLTAENAELRQNLDDADVVARRAVARAHTFKAELRSLRAAVARWAKEFNTPDDFSCERTEALVTAVEGLFALVPSDNSWETELAEGYTPSNPHTPEHVRDNQSNEVPS